MPAIFTGTIAEAFESFQEAYPAGATAGTVFYVYANGEYNGT